jgi:hypothetical protein
VPCIRSTQGAGSGDVGEPYRSRKLRVTCPSCRENNDGSATRNLLPPVRSHQAGHRESGDLCKSVDQRDADAWGRAGGLIGDFDAREMSGKLIRPAALLLGTGRDCRNLLLAGGVVCRCRHQPFNRCSGSSCNNRRPCEGRLDARTLHTKDGDRLVLF